MQRINSSNAFPKEMQLQFRNWDLLSQAIQTTTKLFLKSAKYLFKLQLCTSWPTKTTKNNLKKPKEIHN